MDASVPAREALRTLQENHDSASVIFVVEKQNDGVLQCLEAFPPGADWAGILAHLPTTVPAYLLSRFMIEDRREHIISRRPVDIGVIWCPARMPALAKARLPTYSPLVMKFVGTISEWFEASTAADLEYPTVYARAWKHAPASWKTVS